MSRYQVLEGCVSAFSKIKKLLFTFQVSECLQYTQIEIQPLSSSRDTVTGLEYYKSFCSYLSNNFSFDAAGNIYNSIICWKYHCISFQALYNDFAELFRVRSPEIYGKKVLINSSHNFNFSSWKQVFSLSELYFELHELVLSAWCSVSLLWLSS